MSSPRVMLLVVLGIGCSTGTPSSLDDLGAVDLTLAAPDASAVVLEVTGPTLPEFIGVVPRGWLVESRAAPDRLVIAVFGASLDGIVGTLDGVTSGEVGAYTVTVIEAVGPDNRPLDPGSIAVSLAVRRGP